MPPHEVSLQRGALPIDKQGLVVWLRVERLLVEVADHAYHLVAPVRLLVGAHHLQTGVWSQESCVVASREERVQVQLVEIDEVDQVLLISTPEEGAHG